MWRLDVNFDERNRRVFETNNFDTQKDLTTHTINKFSIQPGLYIIKMFGVYKTRDIQLSNFALCFHEIRLGALSVGISGGTSRSIYYENDLVLDASPSSDPNLPQENQSHLRYSWTCEENVEDFCRMYNTSDPVRTVMGPFQPGSIFKIVLTLYSVYGDREPQKITQKIRIFGNTVADIEMVCLRNCGRKGYTSNTHAMIYFQVEIKKIYVEDISFDYKWSYKYPGLKGEHEVNDIRIPGSPSHVLLIRENVLDLNTTYKFICKLGTGENVALATYTIRTGVDPKIGTCFLDPTEGIMASTNFTLTCENFESNQWDRSLTFEFYCGNENDRKALFLGSNLDGLLDNVLLLGNRISVRIVDSSFMFVIANLTVTLTHKDYSDDEILTKMTVIDNLFRHGDVPGALRRIAVIGVIAKNSTLKNQVISQSLDLLKQMNERQLNPIKLVAVVLAHFLYNVVDEDGLESHLLKESAYIMRDMGEGFRSDMTDDVKEDSEFETRVVRDITESIIECGDVLMIRKSDVEIDNKPVLTSSEEEKVLEYREGFISVVESLEMTAESVGYRLLPYEERYFANTSSIYLWAKQQYDDESEMSEYLSNSKLELNISSDLITELKNTPGSLIVEVISFKNNPFWWYQGLNKEIQSNVLSLKMRKKKDQATHLFSHLKNTLDVYLDLFSTDNTTVRGTAYKINPDDNEDAKDMTVSVHRVETPYAAMVFLDFFEVPAPLKVLVMKDKIPDYEYMEELATPITEENHNYQIKETLTEPESFLYVGVLLDESSNSIHVDYSFRIVAVNCKAWHTTVLSNIGCEVAHDTTLKKLHCICTHLTVFAGAEVLAPTLINPVTEINLFLTLPDNPAVFIATIIALLLYALLMLWSKYKDHKDAIQKTVIVLDDNYPGEEFGYLVCVFTGARIRSGTGANVGIRIFGNNCYSRAHILRSFDRPTLVRNNDDWFLLFTPVHLGDIEKIHVWHDNTGGNADWFCEKILVYDLEKEDEYVFLIDQWLCVGDKDYLEVFMAPVPKVEELTRPKITFENILFGFREMHVWASIFNRHPRSTVNRSHRLAVCMCAIMVSMLASIMFYSVYGHDEDEPFFSFEMQDLLISVLTALICTPVMLVIFFLFQKTERRKSIVRVVERQSQLRMSSTDHSKRILASKVSLSNNLGTGNSNQEPEKDTDVEDVRNRRSFKSQNVIYETVSDPGATEVTRSGGKLYNLYLKLLKKIYKTKPLDPVKIAFIKEDSPKRKLGWVIAAWTISQAVIFMSAFFIILYGLKMGKVRSKLWLLTVAGAVGQDIFLTSPLKILLLALLLAFVYRAYRSQKRHKVRWFVFLEFLIILTFSVILIFLVKDLYSARYYFKNTELKRSLKVPSIHGKINFEEVNNIYQLKEYLGHNLLPKLYKVVWNDKIASDFEAKFGDTGWYVDTTHRLIGVPRIRQLRVRKDACEIPEIIKKANIGLGCTPALNSHTEETRNFKFSWIALNEEKDPGSSPWVYVSKEISGSVNLQGSSGQMYHSGGYFLNLGRNLKQANFTLSELLDSNWLDVYSRFIIIEFTLYNVNVNAFSIIQFVVENLPGGIFICHSQVLSLQVTKEVSFWSSAFIIFSIYFLFRCIYTLNRVGCLNYIFQFWNCFEIIILAFSLANLFVHVGHVLYSSNRIQKFQMEGKESFYSYSALIYYYHLIIVLLTALIVCCIIRMLYQLRTFKLGHRIISFYYTISFCARSVFCITLVFIILLLLQSLVVSFRLNAPFINSWKFFFTYKTGYKNILKDSVYPKKRFVVFLYCFSTTCFTIVFIVLYTHYYKIAKAITTMKPNLVNYFSFLWEEFLSLCSKRKNRPGIISTRLRGGMNPVIPQLSKFYEMLMLVTIQNFIKSSITQTVITQTDYLQHQEFFKKRQLQSYILKNKKQVNNIVEYENVSTEYFKMKMSNLDFMLSSVISQIDTLLDYEMRKLDKEKE